MIRIPKLKILSLGGVNIDLCAKITEFPSIDEEVEVLEFEELPGGSAANYIVGVARLGISAGFMGKLGDDIYAQKLIDAFIQDNVDISQVKTEKSTHSGTCLIPIDHHGNRQIFSFRGANAKLNLLDINHNYLRQASLLHITSPPLEVAEFAAKLAKSNQVFVSYDPGGKVIRKGLDLITPVLQNADLFLPSNTELNLLFPEISDARKAGQKLLDNFGIQIIAIKLGSKGCLIITNKEELYVKGFQVKVIDTTGAGDSFAAAFTVGLMKKWPLSKCGEFANAAAALTVTRVGARTALPTLQEVKTFLMTNKEQN